MSSIIDARTTPAPAASVAARTDSPKAGPASPRTFRTVLIPHCGWPKDAPAPKGRKRAARP